MRGPRHAAGPGPGRRASTPPRVVPPAVGLPDAFPVAVALLVAAAFLAGCGGPPASAADCPGHWHASLRVVVDGHVVSFAHPAFQLEGRGTPGNTMPMASHLHRGDDAEWHLEPSQPRCIPFSAAVVHAGMALAPGNLTLFGAHAQVPLGSTGKAQAGSYLDDGARVLTAYHQLDGAPWLDIPVADLAARQLRDGERVLVLFGHYEPDEVRLWQDSVPLPRSYVANQHRAGHEPSYPPATPPR